MGRHPHPELVRLTARVPRGHDGFWKIIRELDQSGPWSVQDVDGETNIRHYQTINDFVGRLVKGGIAECVAEKSVPRTGQPMKFYRLLKRPFETPSLRRDGTMLQMPAQQRMWNAIRSLKCFSLEDLAYAASDDAGPVPARTAQRYANHLVSAGYLTRLPNADYRFKRSMDTGPYAPKILRMHVVWDSNRNAVISNETEAEVAS